MLSDWYKYIGFKFGKSNAVVSMIHLNFGKGLKLSHINHSTNQENMVKMSVLQNIQRVFSKAGLGPV